MNFITFFTRTFILLALSIGITQTAFSKPKINPKSYELNQKAAAAAQAGDLKKAESLLDKSLEIDPGNLTAAYNLASVYLQREKPTQAVKLLMGYTEHHKKDAGLHARLGDAYFASKEIKEAKAHYEKALELDKNHPKISARLGTLYSLDNDIDNAIKMYLAAVKQEPKNSQYLANLSSLFLANKEAQKAIGVAKKALQMRASSELYITLGAAFEDLKDYKSSLIAYKRAIDLGGDEDKLEDKIDELEDKIS